MATYIILFRYTQQGIKNIKDSPGRIEAVRQAFKAAGAEFKQWFLTMGQYDGAVIVEAPDDETLAKLVLGIGSLGNVSTETLRAFTEDEFKKLVAALP